jgi:succinate dehydrogenase / fumarate reductase iron-sulfur subunit
VNLTLRVWRQKTSDSQGAMETYKARDISEHCSFLEMLDQVNETLISRDEAPIAFDHDCREGICGMCSLVINGVPHSPQAATTAC